MRMRAGTDRGTPDAGTETRERARARVGMVVALVGSIAVACSSGAADGSSPSPSTALTPIVRPSATGEIAITSPKNGATIQGSDVPVEIDLEGATLVATTTRDLQPDEGHVHVILDDDLVTLQDKIRGTLRGVSPGDHLLRVEFVASDHGPFNPRVLDDVTFEVQP